jgi:hypothetical protein
MGDFVDEFTDSDDDDTAKTIESVSATDSKQLSISSSEHATATDPSEATA